MDRFQVTSRLTEFWIDAGKSATVTNIGSATVYGSPDAPPTSTGTAAWSLAPGASRTEDVGAVWVLTAAGTSSTLTVDPIASGLATDTGTGVPSAIGSGGSGVALTERGAWATSTAYAAGDTVNQTGYRYICTSAHTAGTFATDKAAGKWLIVGLAIDDTAAAASAQLPTYSTTSGKFQAQTALQTAGGPSYGFVPTNFKKWRKALSQVRNGGGYAKVLVASDSTAWGKGGGGSNPPFTNAWPKRLQELLNSYYVPATIGLNAYGNPDPADSRWTLGSGWATASIGLTGLGGYALKGASGGSGTLAFAPGYSCDTADIYLVQNTGLGSTTVSVDGGSGTAINTSGTAGVKKVTISFPAGSAHTISFTGATTSDVYVLGIDCYDSTVKSVRMSLTGVSASKAADWASNSQPYTSVNIVKAYAPDLTIIMLGINEGQSGDSVATWQANMQSLITACQISGDVVIGTVVPSGTGAATYEVQYAAATPALASTNNCGVVDILARWVDYSTANTAGYMSDTLHPTGFGYVDIAQAMFNALKTI